MALPAAAQRGAKIPQALGRLGVFADLFDHLAIVGRRAEQLRVIGNDERRIEIERLGEILQAQISGRFGTPT